LIKDGNLNWKIKILKSQKPTTGISIHTFPTKIVKTLMIQIMHSITLVILQPLTMKLELRN